MTNLRLPGQYDEHLLGSLGLQGPYYNWNRWYLPGVGRYLELDPIALRGGNNGAYGPDWYNYARDNPLTFTDSTGLYSEVCWRNVLGPLSATGAQHCFLRVLDHLGLDSTGPPVARAAPPPEQVDLGPSYGAADPIYPE